MDFRWNEWNLDHATRHGISPAEAESLVRRGPGHHVGSNKYCVQGRGVGARFIQVIYVIEPGERIYVIHARPLTEREKRRFRRDEP